MEVNAAANECLLVGSGLATGLSTAVIVQVLSKEASPYRINKYNIHKSSIHADT